MCKDLRTGSQCKDLRTGGSQCKDLRTAGSQCKDLRTGGSQCKDLRTAGSQCKDLRTGGSQCKDLRTGSQCMNLRTGVIYSDVLVLVSILAAVFWMSCTFNGLLWKETITIIHPAGDKGMNKFLQVLNGNKTSNSCNVFEMIVC